MSSLMDLKFRAMDMMSVLLFVSLFTLMQPAVSQSRQRGRQREQLRRQWYLPDESRPTFIVTAPKHGLPYNADIKFSISATGVSRRETINLLLQTGAEDEVLLNSTTLVFDTDGVQIWTVVVDYDQMASLHTQAYPQIVQLKAVHTTQEKTMNLKMNPLSGHLLIQTDKVLYSPRQTVMYRILALDDNQRFSKWQVTVDIKNQDQIIVERQHFTSRQAFIGKNFTLPEEALPGLWVISARYGGMLQTTRTFTFEVKEYVLPTFKAEINVHEKVIGISTNWIKISVKAKYSYGEPVQGQVVMRLGIVRAFDVALFPTVYRGMLNQSGIYEINVPVRDMRNNSLWFPFDSRLFVGVNVTEAGTRENGTAADMETYFANPYYGINFASSKKYFKPGFLYTLVADVIAANRVRASRIPVYIQFEIVNRDTSHERSDRTLLLDDQGQLVESIMMPRTASSMQIFVSTLDPRVLDRAQTTEGFIVNTFNSVNRQYVHLSKVENRVVINFTPGADLAIQLDLITVLVYAKGNLMYATSVPRDASGQQSVTLSEEVLRASSPSARVLAYYFYRTGNGTEMVSDSLYIKTGHICREEISLLHYDETSIFDDESEALPKPPRHTVEFDIQGSPNMTVGLLAVDKAVYFLRDRNSLTRDTIFSSLDERDQGKGIGDGNTADRVFENTGVQYMLIGESYDNGFTGPIQIDTSRLRANMRDEIDELLVGQSIFFSRSQDDGIDKIPLNEIRRYFPESWLFKELTLPESGLVTERFILPDSITTWAFTAVGVAPTGGVCMSRPLEIVVFKPFFVILRLPYKAVRLEELTVHIGIYRYHPFPLDVTVRLLSESSLCFSDSVGGQKSFTYSATVPARGSHSQEVRMIPLEAGDLRLIVDVRAQNGLERDIVEKMLYVVAEGWRVQKTITFPLDPSGNTLNHLPVNSRIPVQVTDSATVTSRVTVRNSKQLTNINLFMPEEVIMGSEKCQISACGDLMGDIISNAVIDGDNLFESSILDAEEAIGNLAPAIHALLYLNNSVLMTPQLQSKGQVYVSHGVMRILTYRAPDGSYALTPNSASAVWLTAYVLKTLCHAEKITFVEHDRLIDHGFNWLLDQMNDNGTLRERDHRLARPSQEYNIMLSAEVLIAVMECGRTATEDHVLLMENLDEFLSNSLENITTPLVMAKTAYALMLHAQSQEAISRAMQRLNEMRQTTSDGLSYWSVTADHEPTQKPYWYHSGAKASAIEATAYALLVVTQQAARESVLLSQNVGHRQPSEESDLAQIQSLSSSMDSIAGWLIQKRNSRGAYIGAMDTTAATQALSEYSKTKQGLQINLHCSVSTSSLNYTRTFDFTMEDAIMPKSLTNVPVGQQLQVITRGTGLGQMHVRVDYNVPVKLNEHCRYNVSVMTSSMDYSSRVNSTNPVCKYCHMDCENSGRSRSRVYRRNIGSSSRSICVQVCLRSLDSSSDRTILEVQMLSGFKPYDADIKAILDKRESLDLRYAAYSETKTSALFTFDEIDSDKDTCVSFRALEVQRVNRRSPAIVHVRAHEDPAPTCVMSYDPVDPTINLAMYCSSNQTNNQGQCRCFSGYCGRCQNAIEDITLYGLRELLCMANYAFKIEQISRQIRDSWVDIEARVISVIKEDGQLQPSSMGLPASNRTLHLAAPGFCSCPHKIFAIGSPIYFFASSVDIFVDNRNGQRVTYVIDDTATFLEEGSNDRTRNLLNLVTC